MAHLGLTPQSVHRLGGFKVQGRGTRRGSSSSRRPRRRRPPAPSPSSSNACRPTSRPRSPSALSIPTIGIGAGAGCTGQVLVYHDLLGMEERIAPRFVRRYAELGQALPRGDRALREDVRAGRFPSPEEGYGGGPAKPAEEPAKLYG